MKVKADVEYRQTVQQVYKYSRVMVTSLQLWEGNTHFHLILRKLQNIDASMSNAVVAFLVFTALLWNSAQGKTHTHAHACACRSIADFITLEQKGMWVIHLSYITVM